MRSLLLTFALLLPFIGRAQLFGGAGFEEGSYVLTDSPRVRRAGQVKLRDNLQLTVKETTGKTLRLKPEQVSCFYVGRRKYVTAGNFHIRYGLAGDDVKLAFVEQLDSGQVMLLRYEYGVGAPSAMGAGGVMTGDIGYEASAYLLRWPSDVEVTVAQSGAYSSGGKKFREAVQPFLVGRPDLLKLLDEKRINDRNLPAAIRALNANAPFNPPSVLNME